jgi:2,4-dienoyl-CoA reductase (NADPH2)
MYQRLFSGMRIEGIELKNRLVMAPLYLGYASKGGGVSPLLLEHYRLMAQSGVAVVVVENATVDFDTGRGSSRTLRADRDEVLDGLGELASAIKGEGALACLQINHGGRFAAVSEPIAPSAVDAFGRRPRPMTRAEIETAARKFSEASVRVKKAGFDMVELHGGTGYLLAQFVSPHTNRRDDEYGGSVENRMRFPLEVLKAVKSAVGDFPVGYRFLADEWLPDGLKLKESIPFARRLSEAGAAYLSVMGGTYESFGLPEIVQRSAQPGYMVDLAAAVKKGVAIPVIAAGRISTGRLAEDVLTNGQADLIGLARVLWADPEWPQKVREGREEEIIQCDQTCGETCMQLVMKGKPAFCVRWPHEKMRRFKEKYV